MYSYKAPRDKPLFDKMTMLWLIFVSLSLIGVIAYGIYLHINASKYDDMVSNLNREYQKASLSINDLQNRVNEIKNKRLLYNRIVSSNRLLNRGIKTIFAVIPDQITIKKMVMNRDSLRLEGLTLTKDAYRLLLEPPLKSTFIESRVTFKFDPYIGKYKFVSLNSSEGKKDDKKEQ